MKFCSQSLQASLELADYVTRQTGTPHAPPDTLIRQAWLSLSRQIALQAICSEFKDGNWRDIIKSKADLLNRRFISDLIVETEETIEDMGRVISASKINHQSQTIADMFYPNAMTPQTGKTGQPPAFHEEAAEEAAEEAGEGVHPKG